MTSPTASLAREISYAGSAQSRAGRVLIRSVENMTGRIGLIRRVRGYEREVAAGRGFWDVMVERFGLSLTFVRGGLEDIPAEGPLLVIANHPYGILDGLILGYVLAQRRSDFRILANQVFQKAPDLKDIILPVCFDRSEAASALNLRTRAAAMEVLASGGCIGIFPGGTVSTSARLFGRPLDPGWRRFTARMVARSGASVVPVFFEGGNSRLFQIASHLHMNLRLALLLKEFSRRVGGEVRLAVGRPLPQDEIDRHAGDAPALMDYLRAATYHLSPEPIGALGYGFDFGDPA
jgi:putative hemolysin